MTDPQQTSPPPSGSPIPPPPPRTGRSGCLRVGLAGCGALVLLGVILIVAGTIWWRRNGGEITARAGEGARDGARVGLVSDEAACFDTARRRIGVDSTFGGTFAVASFARGCLEYSRETPGFCDSVPPATAIRRTVDWQQAKCGTDVACRQVSQVVQQYCSEGRPKRTAADTLLMAPAAAPPAGAGVPAGDSAAVDGGRF